MEQTYQVSASATKPATVRPPFPAHGLTATNNATVLVTIASDQGDTFDLTPGQSKTQGYRGSPGQWTVTATKDGPGSVALTFTDQFTAGDATPQNVAQSASGNSVYLLGNQYTPTIGSVTLDTSGLQELLLDFTVTQMPVNNPLEIALFADNNLPTSHWLAYLYVQPAWAALFPNNPYFRLGFGRGHRFPLGTNLLVNLINNTDTCGVALYVNGWGG